MAFNPDEVEITVTCEPMDYGPESADFDDKKSVVADINERLESTEWAWCQVIVTGWYRGCLTAETELGECSYEDADDFIKNSGYYESMVKEVTQELEGQYKEVTR